MIPQIPFHFEILILSILVFSLVSTSFVKLYHQVKRANPPPGERNVPALLSVPVSSWASASFSVSLRTVTNAENQFSFCTILLSSSLTPASFPFFSAAETCYKRKAELKNITHPLKEFKKEPAFRKKNEQLSIRIKEDLFQTLRQQGHLQQ